MSLLKIRNKDGEMQEVLCLRGPKGEVSEEQILAAVKETTIIPNVLPNPNKLVFSGAVSAEYDGTTEINIHIPEQSQGGILDEEDPTVSEWAKQPNKPTYTAEEVGAATEQYVNEAIENIDIPTTDLTGYATEKYVDDAIANIDIPEETDPTVPEWAKQPNKPIYTAAEVGAATEGYVNEAIEKAKESCADKTDVLNHITGEIQSDGSVVYTLETNKKYYTTVNANCIFSLPTVDKGKDNTILVYASFTDAVSVHWGEDVLFYGNEAPTIEAGYYDIIFTFDVNAMKWTIGVLGKGAVTE